MLLIFFFVKVAKRKSDIGLAMTLIPIAFQVATFAGYQRKESRSNGLRAPSMPMSYGWRTQRAALQPCRMIRSIRSLPHGTKDTRTIRPSGGIR